MQTIVNSKGAEFSSDIKKQLLSAEIKNECCAVSFLTGASVFARKRKNSFTEAVEEYCSKLKNRKQKHKAFFDDSQPKGFLVSGSSASDICPVSSGRVCQHCAASLVRAAFLVCGRASRTEKGLHLELVMPNSASGTFMLEILSGAGIQLKRTVRRGEELLYCRRAETVEDLLSFIGAVSVSFELMNDTIVKDIRRAANRQKNCDTTNVMKAVDAAARQTEAINAIIAHGSLDELPAAVRETAVIRLENPIEPLEVLAGLHSGGISKSGVYHRLNKIVEYALKKGYIE